jgi:hypothetical protein
VEKYGIHTFTRETKKLPIGEGGLCVKVGIVYAHLSPLTRGLSGKMFLSEPGAAKGPKTKKISPKKIILL